MLLDELPELEVELELEELLLLDEGELDELLELELEELLEL